MYGLILTVRSDSKRVPQKWKAKFNGIEALKIIIDRCSDSVDKVVIATTSRDVDREIYRWCKHNGILVFAGEYENVRKRIYDAAMENKISNIVEVLGDNLYINNEIISKCINAHRVNKALFVSNRCTDYSWVEESENIYPIGIRPLIYSVDLLEKYLNTDVEGHPTSSIYQSNEVGKVLLSPSVKLPDEIKRLNLSLNYKKNADHFRYIFEKYGHLVGLPSIYNEFLTNSDLVKSANQSE